MAQQGGVTVPSVHCILYWSRFAFCGFIVFSVSRSPSRRLIFLLFFFCFCFGALNYSVLQCIPSSSSASPLSFDSIRHRRWQFVQWNPAAAVWFGEKNVELILNVFFFLGNILCAVKRRRVSCFVHTNRSISFTEHIFILRCLLLMFSVRRFFVYKNMFQSRMGERTKSEFEKCFECQKIDVAMASRWIKLSDCWLCGMTLGQMSNWNCFTSDLCSSAAQNLVCSVIKYVRLSKKYPCRNIETSFATSKKWISIQRQSMRAPIHWIPIRSRLRWIRNKVLTQWWVSRRLQR